MTETAQKNAQEMLRKVESSPSYQWGWGPSDLASKQERDAYEYLQKRPLVESGQISPAELPEAYGGRPQGTTRRAIRMQSEWDAQQAARLAEQQAIQQEQRLAKQEEREGFRFMREQYNYDAQLKLDALNEKTAAEQEAEVDAIASGLSSINLKAPNAIDAINQLALDNPMGAIKVAKQLENAKAIAQNYGVSDMEKERLAAVALAERTGRSPEEFGQFDGEIFVPNREEMIRTEVQLEQEEKARSEAAPKLNQISKEINEIEEKRILAVAEYNAEKRKPQKEAIGRNIAAYDEQLIRRNNQIFDVDPVLKQLPRVKSEEDLEGVEVGQQFVAVGSRGKLTVRTKQEIPEEPVETEASEDQSASTPLTLEERLEQKSQAVSPPQRARGRRRKPQEDSEEKQLESRKKELESLLYRQTGRGKSQNLRPSLSSQDPDVKAALSEIESIDQRLKNL
jgi:hypothetical protein